MVQRYRCRGPQPAGKAIVGVAGAHRQPLNAGTLWACGIAGAFENSFVL